MKTILLPLGLVLVGAAAGIGAGLTLRPAPSDAGMAAGEAGASNEAATPLDATPVDLGEVPIAERERPSPDQTDYVRLNNQFVVPVLEDGQMKSLVVLSLSIETRIGMREIVFGREPKLRDAFLQVMFDHANAGGFDDVFTASPRITTLRKNLWEAALPILGPEVYDVLITDIARQDT